jgi:hypothetical protein
MTLCTIDQAELAARKAGNGRLLVLHRTDGAHRRMLYLHPRQSRLHLNLLIKNGERGSL